MEKVKIAGILGIMVIEIVALYVGVDGQALASALMLISGIVCYEVGAKRGHERSQSQTDMEQTKAT